MASLSKLNVMVDVDYRVRVREHVKEDWRFLFLRLMARFLRLGDISIEKI